MLEPERLKIWRGFIIPFFKAALFLRAEITEFTIRCQ